MYGLMGGFHVPDKYQCQYREIVKRSQYYEWKSNLLDPKKYTSDKTKGTLFTTDGVYVDGVLQKEESVGLTEEQEDE